MASSTTEVQTGTWNDNLTCLISESEISFFENKSKKTWNFKKKKFLIEKISGMKILKTSQTHVNR